MFPKTESRVITRGFLWQIGLLTILVLIMVTYANKAREGDSRGGVQDSQSVLFPWMIAARHTLENGLAAFSGEPPKTSGIVENSRALAALLLGAVICPTIFLLGWRRRRFSGVQRESPLSLSGVFYGLCTALALCIAISVLPMAVWGEQVRSSLRSAQDVQFNRDAIIGEISLVSFHAREHYILPKQVGGGGKSYEQFTLPSSMLKTENAEYAIGVKKQEIDIRASSVLFSGCTIEVKLDSTGRLRGWTYTDKFR